MLRAISNNPNFQNPENWDPFNIRISNSDFNFFAYLKLPRNFVGSHS